MTLEYLAINKIKKKPDFDTKNQIIEEAAELIVAFNKYERDPTEKNSINICEEISDLWFCLIAHCYKEKIDINYLNEIAQNKTLERFPEEV